MVKVKKTTPKNPNTKVRVDGPESEMRSEDTVVTPLLTDWRDAGNGALFEVCRRSLIVDVVSLAIIALGLTYLSSLIGGDAEARREVLPAPRADTDRASRPRPSCFEGGVVLGGKGGVDRLLGALSSDRRQHISPLSPMAPLLNMAI